MSVLSQQEFVKKTLAEGDNCPVCGALDEDLSHGELRVEGLYCIQEKVCIACGAEWNNVYALDGYSALLDKEGNSIEEPPQSLAVNAETKDLLRDCWHFIENVNEDTPDRTKRFFALRERIRAVL